MNDHLFENEERIIALAPELVGTLFPTLLAEHGVSMPEGSREVVTIGAFWHDTARTTKRAASLHDGTIQGRPLTDGRAGFQCLWVKTLTALFTGDGIEGVEELTPEEYAALLPSEEEDL